MSRFPFRWSTDALGVLDRDRTGEACRVVTLGGASALVEFADGYRVVTSPANLEMPNATKGTT